MYLNRITRLYPQYQRSQDRRQNNIPVAVERRSGKDRRSEDRVVLDKQLTKDIYEVKRNVAKLEALSPKLFESNVTKQAPTFSAMNNMTQDMFVKESKPDPTEIARREAELQDRASTTFQIGVISAALACAIGLSFLSSAGAVIAIGTTLYIGGKVLGTLISKHVKDKDKTEKD